MVLAPWDGRFALPAILIISARISISTRISISARISVGDPTAAIGRILNQLLGSRGEDIELRAPDDETKVFEEAADLVLEVTLDLDQQRQARRSALTAWLSRSLTPISLHQPVCLMRRLAQRASMQITGKPSRLSWVDSHVAGGPISRPIRTGAFDLTNAETTSGSESTTPSRTTEHKVL